MVKEYTLAEGKDGHWYVVDVTLVSRFYGYLEAGINPEDKLTIERLDGGPESLKFYKYSQY